MLEKMATSGQALSKDVLKGFFAILRDQQVDDFTRSKAAETLDELAKSGETLSREILKGFFVILRDRNADDRTQSRVVVKLGKMATSGQTLSKEVLKELFVILIDWKAEYKARSRAAAMLEKMATSEQALSKDVLEGFFAILRDQNADDWARVRIAAMLWKMAKSGQALSKEMAEGLIAILRDREVDDGTRGEVAVVFGKMTKSGQALPKEVLEGLIAILRDRNADYRARGRAAAMLEKMVKSGQVLPKEVLERLSAILRDRKVDNGIRGEVAEVLGKMAKSGLVLSKDVVEELFAILRDRKINDEARGQAADALVEVAQSGLAVPQAELLAICSDTDFQRKGIRFFNPFAKAYSKFLNQYESQVLRKLFFLTGRAFFYQDEAFYTSGSEKPLVTKRSVDLQKIYREYLGGNLLHPENSWNTGNKLSHFAKAALPYLPMVSFYRAYKISASQTLGGSKDSERSKELKKIFSDFITKNGIRRDVQFIESYSTCLGDYDGMNWRTRTAATIYLSSGLDRHRIHFEIIGERELIHLKSHDRMTSSLFRGVMELVSLIFMTIIMRRLLYRSSYKIYSLVISLMKSGLSLGVSHLAGEAIEMLWTFYTELRADRKVLHEASAEKLRAGIQILQVQREDLKNDWEQLSLKKKISIWISHSLLGCRISRILKEVKSQGVGYQETEDDRKLQDQLLKLIPGR